MQIRFEFTEFSALVDFLGSRGAFFACCKSARLDVDQEEPSYALEKITATEHINIVRGGRDENGLSPADRFAIWLYSSTDACWYARINEELWSGSPSPETTAVAELLNNALPKLPVHDGMVFRGFNAVDLDHFMATYDVGIKVRWLGFTSCSLHPEKAFEGNVYFRIRSHSGRILGTYADNPDEEEILFQSGTPFIVMAVERRDGAAVIELEELAS